MRVIRRRPRQRFWTGLAILSVSVVGLAYYNWDALGEEAKASGEAPAAAQEMVPTGVQTGTHWAEPIEFPTLARLGYNFVIITLDPDDRVKWSEAFDAAKASGLRLIVGLYPEPYHLEDGAWSITKQGQDFLRYAAARSELVKSIFVYNEPYWVDPFTRETDPCGALSAAELRALRDEIRNQWPAARIYHDIGGPSHWTPEGFLSRSHKCLGDKFADQRGVADDVGIWFFPFVRDGDRRVEGRRVLEKEIAFVREKMLAEPIIAAQAFRCAKCENGIAWPTKEEMKDWNCQLRDLKPYGISWYPWRQSSYEDYLSNHPEMWPVTTAASCP